MSGRRTMSVSAIPIRMRFLEECYELTVKIDRGPTALLDRILRVRFTSEQLSKIGEWEPKQLLDLLDLEAPSVK